MPTIEAPSVCIIGAGLAGSEAALQLAKRGVPVTLYDLKPHQKSAAHHSPHYAEIVCSNSLGSEGLTAAGLLKAEMTMLGGELLQIAQAVRVPAGQALAVDRERFAEAVTERLQAEPMITLKSEEITTLETGSAYTLIATGPLTTPALSDALSQASSQNEVQSQPLYFFDAAAPIITKESINLKVAFVQDRYGHSDSAENGEASYINCPLNQAQYEALVEKLLTAEKIPLKSFEEEAANSPAGACFFESCMPVEVIASRGPETLRYGPMKPVGLLNPHTGEQPYAVVQLRQDNAQGTLYNLVGFQTNLKWGEQKALLALIPGLEEAEIMRYGVMHRNTYLHSPNVLRPTLQLKALPNVLIAGQLTGTEGYSESIATGLWAALNIHRLLQGKQPLVPPPETMLGALLAYITRPEAQTANGGKGFQPINSNWGLMPPFNPSVLQALGVKKIKSKPQKAQLHSQRAQTSLETFLKQQGLEIAFKTPMTVG